MRVLFVLSVVIAPLLFAGAARAASNPGDLSGYYEDALSRFERGKYRAAIVQLKNALQKNPANLSARVLIGRAYLKIGDPAAAEKEFKRARRSGADDSQIAVPLARAYLAQRKFHRIFTEFQRGSRSPDIEAELLVIKGDAYIETHDIERAEAAFSAARRLRPGYWAPYLGLARVKMGSGETQVSKALVERAIRIAPGNAEAWRLKGEITRMSGDAEGALPYFAKSIELQPEQVTARASRAAALLELFRFKEARPDVEYMIRHQKNNPWGPYMLSLIRAREGDAVGAQAAMREAAATVSKIDRAIALSDGPSLLAAGVINFAHGKLDDAYLYLTRYIELVPSNASARRMLGTLLVRRGDSVQAIQVLQPVLRLTPDDPRIYALLGSAYMMDRKYTRATELFQQAITLTPDPSIAYTRLALSKIAAGDTDSGLVDLATSLKIDERSVHAGVLLGLINLKKGRYDEAIRNSETIRKRGPRNPLAYEIAGAAYMKKGDLRSARENFQAAAKLAPRYLPPKFSLAELDIREGKLKDAKARYEGILAKNALNTRAMIEMSRLAEREGRIDDAARWLKGVRNVDAKAVSAQIHLINLYVRSNQPQKALDAADTLERSVPFSVPVLEAKGRAELAAGEFPKAAATYRRLSGYLADSAPRLLKIAALQMRAQDLDGARQSLRRAINADSDHLPTHAAKIQLEASVGNYDEAFALVDQLSITHSKSALSDMLRGDLLIQTNRPEEALVAYERGLEKERTPHLIARLYQTKRRLGDGAEALKILSGWLADHPDDGAIRRALAVGHMEIGDYETAVQHHEEILKTSPEDAGLMNNLAILYQRKRDPRAMEYAQRALGIAPHHPAMLDTFGWILVQNGQAARGLKMLREADARTASDPRVRFHIAVALDRLGRSDDARRALKELLADKKEFEGIDEARALLARLSKS